MAKAKQTGFWTDFKTFFVRGLATLLPTVLTIFVLFKCYEFVQQNFGVPINQGIIQVILRSTTDYPEVNDDDIAEFKREHKIVAAEKPPPEMTEDIRRWKLQRQWNQGAGSLVGFVVAIIFVYVLGRLLASFLGRRLWQMFEGTVQQVPGFKQVYPYIKQVTEFLFGDRKFEFSRVVAVPYPRQGMYSVGLVTGAGFRRVASATQEDYLTVFIPSSPTPVTGYVIYVKKSEVIDLPITLEEALRFTASGGVIVPEHEELPEQQLEASRGPSVSASREESKD